MEKICVAVRMRPPVTQDHNNTTPFSSSTYWKIDENRVNLHKPHGTPISSISYTFDHVFDESCSNAEVHELLTKDIIHAAVDGFNGTAFAYGQTSSGKTFTMNGSKTDPGIIYQAVHDIFARIKTIAEREFLIRVSYMEIYNEEIKDLLAVENQKLQIHENLERGVFVAGLREEIVKDAEQVLKLIEIGEVNRHFGETNMNVRSSRSHTIFRMVIESKGKDPNSSSENADAIRFSVLNLVDLAGSERIAKTGADGVRLREGKHINKSLLMLGNVINKLSDGSKQRGHIPYRDSKLTRILQPALGGNAKTSIICTIAPEEVHIEETKGTLQFASRAKRITNCAQVNEILTDAALLKRQQLEIEELRKKLEGSHAEVLEQEILKLRNQMLKFELEKEKLEMELEEERKSQREQNQCIKEQQIQIDNLNSIVTSSDHDQTSQSQSSVGQYLKEECNRSSSIVGGDVFGTPSFKAIPGAFVAKRSSYSRLPDDSPLPDAFTNVADEDTWLKMNKGYVADLDLLQTPARNDTLFPSNTVTPACLSKNFQQEVENLKRQLELVLEEKNELEKRHTEQKLLNNQLVAEVSELKQEALLIQEFPQKLGETMANCKDIYDDVLSTIQSSISDEKLVNDKLLSSISEIGTCLISTLESHLLLDKEADNAFSKGAKQRKVLSERLERIIKDLFLFETSAPRDQQKSMQSSCKDKGCIVGEETAGCNLATELNNIKERYIGLEKELDCSNKLLEASKQGYDKLEKEYQNLKDDRNSLLIRVSETSEKLALISDQKENIVKGFNAKVQNRKVLEEEMKKFRDAFSSRQKSFLSFHKDLKSKLEILKAQNPAMAPKSLGL